jgi:hypothetical protein
MHLRRCACPAIIDGLSAILEVVHSRGTADRSSEIHARPVRKARAQSGRSRFSATVAAFSQS